MGRQTGDPTTVSPSIALLQERFRHLEKVKERREERDLLKLFSETERNAPTMVFDQHSKSSFQSEMIIPHRSTLQDSLSLGLNLRTDPAGLRAMKMQPLTNSWPYGTAATAGTSKSSENSGVDTSLHL